jgi:hypothetical protein
MRVKKRGRLNDVHFIFNKSIMKKFLLIFLLIFYVEISFSQTFDWDFGNNEKYHTGRAIATDKDNNFYALIGGKTDHLYLKKFSPNGDILWEKLFYCAYNYLSLTTDNKGNIYAVFASTIVRIDNEDGGSEYYGKAGDFGGLVFKFSHEGELLLNIHYNPTEQYDAIKAITVDTTGNIYLGCNIGTLYWNGGNAFIQKYDSEGNFLWEKETGNWTPVGIRIDPDNNIILAGEFQQGTVQFDSYEFYREGAGYEALIIKMTDKGSVLWARREGADNGRNYLKYLEIDKKGNIYLTGSFGSPNEFSGSPLNGGERGSMFIAKYAPSGEMLWVRNAKNGVSKGISISINADGDCFVVGNFFETVNFIGEKKTATLVPIKSNNIFIVKYSANGDLVGAIRPEGNEIGGNFVRSSCIDSNNKLYITGLIRGVYDGVERHTSMVKFKNELKTDQTNSFFIARMIDDGTLNIEKSEEGRGLNIFPNPTRNQLNIEYNQTNPVGQLQLRIYGLTGNIIHQEVTSEFSGKFSKLIDLGSITKGVYFIEIQAGKERSVKKVILQ